MKYPRIWVRPEVLFLAKKLVIWCLSAREFTENVDGWRSVPIVR